jgi:hypothetical protein
MEVGQVELLKVDLNAIQLKLYRKSNPILNYFHIFFHLLFESLIYLFQALTKKVLRLLRIMKKLL